MGRTELVAVLVALGMFAMFIVGGIWGYSVARRSAVRAGAAEWVADEDGKPEFLWIVPEDK